MTFTGMQDAGQMQYFTRKMTGFTILHSDSNSLEDHFAWETVGVRGRFRLLPATLLSSAFRLRIIDAIITRSCLNCLSSCTVEKHPTIRRARPPRTKPEAVSRPREPWAAATINTKRQKESKKFHHRLGPVKNFCCCVHIFTRRSTPMTLQNRISIGRAHSNGPPWLPNCRLMPMKIT